MTWLSTVGIGSIKASICSRLASRLRGGGEEVWGAADGPFEL